MTHPIICFTVLKLADSVMLAPERHQIRHRGVIAPLDISTNELPALREAYCVDSGGFGEGGMGGEVCTDLVDLQVEIAQESRCSVGGGVIVKADIIGVGARVCFVGEGADRAEAFSFVAILYYYAQTYSRGRKYLSPRPCHITSGRGVDEDEDEDEVEVGALVAGAKWACGMIAPWMQQMTDQMHKSISGSRAITTIYDKQEVQNNAQQYRTYMYLIGDVASVMNCRLLSLLSLTPDFGPSMRLTTMAGKVCRVPQTGHLRKAVLRIPNCSAAPPWHLRCRLILREMTSPVPILLSSRLRSHMSSSTQYRNARPRSELAKQKRTIFDCRELRGLIV